MTPSTGCFEMTFGGPLKWPAYADSGWPDYADSRQRQVRWAQLAGHAVITVRPGYGIRPLIDATAARAGVALNVVNEVAFLATALWMADCGLGAAIMPSAYAAHGTHAARVVLPLSAPRVSRDVALVTKRGRSLSPAAQRLVDVLAQAFTCTSGRR